MNILLTNFCNRSCPYCFAKGKLVFEKPLSCNYIKLRELKTIVDFLRRSNATNVGILGGEPTLHPEFKKAVTLLIKAGLHLNIFTNGLIKRDTVLFLKGLGARKCDVVLNINFPGSYTKREWETINRNAELFGSNQLWLGFTIYQPDFNMDFVVDFIQRYNLNKQIRIGIAAPIFGGKNKYVKIADHSRVARRITDFAQRHWSKGISLVFDCGFTLCSFTDQQLGKLLRLGTFMPIVHCGPGIDVGPDLSVWSCFATSNLWNRKLTDFKDLNAAHNFYEKKFSAFRMVGSRNSCFRCSHLQLGHCLGGCIAHTLREFKLENRLDELV